MKLSCDFTEYFYAIIYLNIIKTKRGRLPSSHFNLIIILWLYRISLRRRQQQEQQQEGEAREGERGQPAVLRRDPHKVHEPAGLPEQSDSRMSTWKPTWKTPRLREPGLQLDWEPVKNFARKKNWCHFFKNISF